MNEKDYFLTPTSTKQKQYEALRAYFVDELSATEAANKFGYTFRAFTSLVADFRKHRKDEPNIEKFFQIKKAGRKEMQQKSVIVSKVVELRKAYISVPDIKVILDGQNIKVSEKEIYLIVKQEGFARLPRRSKTEKQTISIPKLTPEISSKIDYSSDDSFNSNSVGLFYFWPIIKHYGIDEVIQNSGYPETKSISKFSSIMSFLALKLSNVRRYSADDLWCMDRGQGLFAGLTVLPKASWFSSYSHRITRENNLSFLRELHKQWKDKGLLGDTVNLDFTTIPYWGDGEHLENNWSGKRRQSLASMLAVLAQDADSGLVDYGDTDVLHKNQDAVVLEYLDFYRQNDTKGELKYLVFDSKFTNYQNLAKLDNDGIMFLTIRRRGKKIVEEINNLPTSSWKTKRVACAGNKNRTLKVNDRVINLKGYGKEIRQIAITGHGKIKPALIITNDFKMKAEEIIRKYSRRWLVEKTISEQIDFFHLNRVSSSMVIKVDFDMTMTILAHNLYRLLAMELDRYSHLSDTSIYEKFVMNSGEIEIMDNEINLKLKKKKNLPLILSAMKHFASQKYPWADNKKMNFTGMSNS
ncbi:MAG: transposase [Psychroflexus sp.]